MTKAKKSKKQLAWERHILEGMEVLPSAIRAKINGRGPKDGDATLVEGTGGPRRDPAERAVQGGRVVGPPYP